MTLLWVWIILKTGLTTILIIRFVRLIHNEFHRISSIDNFDAFLLFTIFFTFSQIFRPFVFRLAVWANKFEQIFQMFFFNVTLETRFVLTFEVAQGTIEIVEILSRHFELLSNVICSYFSGKLALENHLWCFGFKIFVKIAFVYVKVCIVLRWVIIRQKLLKNAKIINKGTGL